MTVLISDFSKDVFESTYQYASETVDDMHQRIAKHIASIEKDKKLWADKFSYILEDFKFVPGGRILSNAGIPIRGTTFLNCFVDGFMGSDQDSWDGISAALHRQGQILKSEGGYGFCVDVLRPRGTFISGIGSETPGAVKMLDMWDTQSEVITSGSGRRSKHKNAKKKIRKGAQMVTMSCFSDSTEILTNLGWINIIELIDRINFGENINAIIKTGEEYEIYDPIINEPEPMFEIETEDGETIQVTASHEFEVRNIKNNNVYLKKICDIYPDLEELCIIQVD